MKELKSSLGVSVNDILEVSTGGLVRFLPAIWGSYYGATSLFFFSLTHSLHIHIPGSLAFFIYRIFKSKNIYKEELIRP
jgi:hypothetical protein